MDERMGTRTRVGAGRAVGGEERLGEQMFAEGRGSGGEGKEFNRNKWVEGRWSEM